MILKNLKASNFYSFKSCDINFAKYKGIVYVRGINRDTGGSNGSGKSSILEMITFALFGKTIRKSTEEAMVNCDTKKGLVVEITVEKLGVGTATIVRGKKPTHLLFSVDGQDRTQENAAKTQELIEDLLGINYKTFVASIVFGQHVDLDFISATPDDKRTIIRNFLNLEDMFSIRDKIKDFKSDFSSEIKGHGMTMAEIKTQLSKLESKLTNVEKVEITETYEQVEARQNKITSFNQQAYALRPQLDEIELEINKMQDEIKKGVYCIKDKCKTCRKVYTKKQTESNIRGFQKKIRGLSKQRNKLLNELYKLDSKLEDLKSGLTVKDWVKLKDKADLYSQQEKLKVDYNDLLARLQGMETKKQECEVNYEIMRFWEKAFSESGIIKYFVRNILDYLNFKTNEYLSILTNNQFTILFNEELDETITNNGRKLSYISLSGGERRKINLSVMLALQSLLTHTSKQQSNIMFFDEIAENMDEDGCKGVHNLLKALKDEDKTIFLITHNAYLKSLLDGCQIFNIQKRNGESVIL
jgi:DNA repair exonuclease SbcCD ATPase subunit